MCHVDTRYRSGRRAGVGDTYIPCIRYIVGHMYRPIYRPYGIYRVYMAYMHMHHIHAHASQCIAIHAHAPYIAYMGCKGLTPHMPAQRHMWHTEPPAHRCGLTERPSERRSAQLTDLMVAQTAISLFGTVTDDRSHGRVLKSNSEKSDEHFSRLTFDWI